MYLLVSDNPEEDMHQTDVNLYGYI